MSNTIDLILTPSKEAKICLDCGKRKCCPDKCDRFRRMHNELKHEATTPKEKN